VILKQDPRNSDTPTRFSRYGAALASGRFARAPRIVTPTATTGGSLRATPRGALRIPAPARPSTMTPDTGGYMGSFPLELQPKIEQPQPWERRTR
jgi:hypothetical protein